MDCSWLRVSGALSILRALESSEQSLYFKDTLNFSYKCTLRQVFIWLRPPPLLGYCLGWPSNFVVSESSQIQSVKLLQNMVYNRTHIHPTLFQPLTV